MENERNVKLTADEVLVPVGGALAAEGGGPVAFQVRGLAEVVQEDIRAAGKYDPLWFEGERQQVYYSAEDALGEGGEEWTEEELARLRRRDALERELGECFNRLGGFCLEEAMRCYFSDELTGRMIGDKPPPELRRIGAWVAYIRRTSGLRNPAGFLRRKIESGEQPPS